MPDPCWSEVTKGRQRAVETLPNILKFPIVGDKMDVFKGIIKKGDRVLDIGANDRHLEKLFKEAGFDVQYRSFDVDRNYQHDYYSLEDIEGPFDVVCAFEVIEHIRPKEILKIFKRAKKLLVKGGFFVVSTPNVCHPVLFWRDCTHITPVRYDEIYGFLHALGFDPIRIYRGGKVKWKDRFWAFVYRPLLKLLRLDFIRHIIVVAGN